MRVLLAGATGVIGRSLLPLLLRHGHNVTAISRHEAVSAEQREGLRWRSIDVLDRDAVFALMEDERPDCIMHQLTDLSSMDSEANALLRSAGTRNLVDAAQGAGIPRMVAQSISWGYEPGSEPADEATPLDVHAHGPRKTTIDGIRALESAVAEMQQFVILRYGTLYGPGTWYARHGPYARRVRDQAIQASAEVSSFVHVEDAATAALFALHWPDGAVNIVDDEPSAASEWLPAYAKLLGATAPPAARSTGQTRRITRPVSNQRARSLGWVPRYASWRGHLGLQ